MANNTSTRTGSPRDNPALSTELAAPVAAIALPTMRITANSASKAEGNTGTTLFTFTVTRSSGVGTASVNWSLVHGTTDIADEKRAGRTRGRARLHREAKRIAKAAQPDARLRM